MTNKQIKILNNKINQVSKEIDELGKNCDTRLEYLARNDGLYQNFQGQLLEKQNRITDYQDFIKMINGEESKNVGPTTQDSGPTESKGRKRKTTKSTSDKDKES